MFMLKEQKELLSAWLGLIHLYDDMIIKKPDLFKETSPVIISCFPWHFTTPLSWDNDLDFSKYIFEDCIKVQFPKLLDDESSAKYHDLIKKIESNIKLLEERKSRQI